MLRAEVRSLFRVAWTCCSTLLLVACGGDSSTKPADNNNPATISLSSVGAISLVSGTSTTVTATVKSASGKQIDGLTLVWSTTDATIASVQNGLITASRAGIATITATTAGITSNALTVSVTPGAPAQLGLRTQPSGASVAAPFSTQPVVEIRDAAGNVVVTSATAVTVALTSGGGTLSGTRTVNASAGVAAFTDLVLTGTAGSRSLGFTAAGLAPAQSSNFVLAPGAATQMVLTTQPQGGATGTQLVVPPVIELRDVAGNVATGSNLAVTASVTFGGGSVSGGTASAVAGVVTFSNLIVNGGIGDKELTFVASQLTPVTSARFTLVAVLYGLATQKVQVVDAGAVVTPTVSAATTPVFTSRAPSRATVDASGRITARAEGQAWLVSSVVAGADSILMIITRSAGGPVLRTSLTALTVPAGVLTTVDVVLDPRTTQVGAANVFVTAFYEIDDFVGSVSPLQVNGVQVAMNQPTNAVFRFSIATTSAITSPVSFGRVQFVAGPAGKVLFVNVTVIDAFGPDGTDLLPRITSTSYPVISR